MPVEHHGSGPEGGRFKAHEPTDIIKAEVRSLKSFGHTDEEIAGYLKISHDTLRRHYSYELENATIDANAQVAKGLFHKATKGDDLSAQIFWLKTRARWKTADSEDTKKTLSAVEAMLLGKKIIE